jgi:hypothetical protein
MRGAERSSWSWRRHSPLSTKRGCARAGPPTRGSSAGDGRVARDGRSLSGRSMAAGRSIRGRGAFASREGRRCSGSLRPGKSGPGLGGRATSRRSESRPALSLSGRSRSTSIRGLSGLGVRGRISPASGRWSLGRAASRTGASGRRPRMGCGRTGSPISDRPGRGRSCEMFTIGIGRAGIRPGWTRGGSPGRAPLSSRGALGSTDTGIGRIGAASPGWRGTTGSGRKPRCGRGPRSSPMRAPKTGGAATGMAIGPRGVTGAMGW